MSGITTYEEQMLSSSSSSKKQLFCCCEEETRAKRALQGKCIRFSTHILALITCSAPKTPFAGQLECENAG